MSPLKAGKDRSMRDPKSTLLVLVLTLALSGLGRRSYAQGSLFLGDAYTAYHLLEPGSDQFRVVFYPSETTPGATILINGTRPGSKGSDIEVYDPQTGKPSKFEYLTGEKLIADKTPGRFTPGEHYIRAHLPRPVPEGGEGRVLIEKTYWDPRSYFVEGDEIVYKRSLGVGRQSIILPKGYALVSSNVAAQLISLPDGRLSVSLANIHGYAADVEIRARKTTAAMGSGLTVAEKAFDRTKTLYDLGPPDTHAYTVSVDYVEEAKGDRSRLPIEPGLQDLKVIDLDTGSALATETKDGLTFAVLAIPLVEERQSAHLKASGRTTNPGYRLEHEELVFSANLRGVRNTVLFPAGWEVTALTTPGTVATLKESGRVFVRVVNGRPEDSVPIALRARKRSDRATQ
jgi:hypothetical protein